MIQAQRHGVGILAVMALIAVSSPAQSQSQSCPAPLNTARRLVLVTAKAMNDMSAEMQLFERASPSEAWRVLAPAEPANLGRGGMAWSRFFRRYAKAGEPLKVEGDKRAPAGIYRIGRSFGILPSSRANYLHVTDDTVCVN
jgi:L,D-peptidoglycan transpeptidase YkuD (ErfK/YbiS/YcfS/YnhG family)